MFAYSEKTRAFFIEWALRISLALVFLYIGSDILLHPNGVLWAVPHWFRELVTPFMRIDVYLRIQGTIELLMGLVMVLWFAPKWLIRAVAVLMSAELLFILLFSPQFAVTFRDIGVLGAGIALYLLLLPPKEEVHVS